MMIRISDFRALIPVVWVLLAGTNISKGAVREVLSLDQGWRFHPGDIAFPVPVTHGQTYHSAKVGSIAGPAAAGFYDTAGRNWKQEPGEFRIFVGRSSADVLLSGGCIVIN